MRKVASVFSPAKVNLHLAIGARRADGYHDARSVMQALTLHDVVQMTWEDDEFGLMDPGAGLQVEVTCTTFEGIEPLDIPSEKNIAHQAVVKLAAALGRTENERISIAIEKHIPHQAGLGGGSSNAAAALVGACKFWDVDPQSAVVTEVAASIGADVPFFLHGGCAILGDRGDVLERTLAPASGTLVLVRPDAGVSTKEAYAAFDAAPVAIDAELSAQVDAAQSAAGLTLFSNLAAASEAVLPELAEARQWLAQQPGVARDARTGQPCVLLSGSGSATFAIMESADAMRKACDIVSAAKLKGWWARSCSFYPAGARVIERAGIFGGGARTNVGSVHKSW